MKHLLKTGLILAFLTVISCTTITSSHQVVCAQTRWGIVPFTNNTEVPLAGYRAMSITQGLLEAKGARHVQVYKSNKTCNQLIVCPNANPPIEKIIAWARARHLRYVMTGTVNEWVYKVGLDGEPVASVTLQLYETQHGYMIWNAVGSKFGNTRSGLGNTGQKLIQEMLWSLKII